MRDKIRKQCRKYLFYPFDLGLKGKMGLERSVTKQKPLCFPVFFLFIFLLFEKKKKGKGKFIGKSARMHFRSNLCLSLLIIKNGK